MPTTLTRSLRDPLTAILSAGVLAGLLLLAAAKGQAPTASPDQEPTGATPDVGPQAPDPFPEVHRAALLERMRVDLWHRAGYRGRGVKVAVLDTGFRGYRDQLGKTLPSRVSTRSFRFDQDLEARDSQHGILCAEVVHAIAPEAELLLANWEPDSPSTWLRAARWAKEQGAGLISCSVIMPSWGDGEGHGPVHEALARILGDGAADGDALFVASAGNMAQRHWGGTFRGGEGGWHEWTPGRTDNALSPWGAEQVSVEVCWHADADFELVVRDATDGEEVGRSSPRDGAGRRGAVVRFTPAARHRYAVRLRQVSGEPAAFHLVALGSGLACSTARGSVCFPADGPEVIAVGAVGADGKRAEYSCCGPNSEGPKPDLVATVPFPSLWRPRPFNGTSAAAPQAAGVAAVLWSAHPDWAAAQVRAALTKSAHDLGPEGFDTETGHGLICLPELASP